MVKLGEVCSIERGGSPRPIKDYITDSQEGLNWIKIGDTDPQGKYIYRTNEKIKPEGLKKTKWVEENDLLLSNSMSYGRPYILKTNGCIHDGWLVIRDYQSSLNTDFFYYLLLSPIVQRQFLLKAQGSTVSNLNTQRVTDVNVLVPPLEEQHRIVSILDASFEKIDALKKNAEENLKNAKALFQQVLAQELKPKEGWVETNMETICTLCQGLAINAQTKHLIVEKSNLPLLRIKDLKDGTREVFIDESNCPENCKVYPNDIIYTRTGTLGLTFTGMNGVMHNNCFKININRDKVDKHYIMYYIQSQSFKDRIIGMAQRAAQPDITHKIFKAQYISYSSLEEQHRIVLTLDTLSEKCRRLEEVAQQTIRECDALKQSILRQAFSGEL